MKNIYYSHELQDKLLQGVSKLSSAVGSTLGPKGRNVMIREKGKEPFITKDGVTVAKHLELQDPEENAAASIVKQASRRTNIEAGDGTTTSTVLAASLYKNAIKVLRQNPKSSPVQIYRGLQKASSSILNNMVDSVKEVESIEDIRHIATISANNDSSIGDLITLAVDKIGLEGSITIEKSNTTETSLDLIEGFSLSSGFASSSFITDDRRRIMKYDEPLFLITDSKLDSVDQILPSLEIAARESRPFIIVCDDIEGQALAALIMNTVRGNMKVAAIKGPKYGQARIDTMSDLALSTGAKFFRKVNGDNLRSVSLTDFGSAKSIQSTNTETLIVGGSGDHEPITNRIRSLRELIKVSPLEEAGDLMDRVNRLESAVAVIRVGGHSEIEVVEKTHRFEDSLEAVRSAQAEGIVPGAGSMLHRYSFLVGDLDIDFENEDQALAREIISESFLEPTIVMLHNAGATEGMLDRFMEKPFEGTFGYDFASGEKVDLLASGIVDPFRVLRCCVRNAVSVAGNLLTTNVSIIED